MNDTPQTIDAFTRFYQTLIGKPEYITTGLLLIILVAFIIIYILDKRNHKSFTDSVMSQNDKREERYLNVIDNQLTKVSSALDGVNSNLIRMNDNFCKMENRIEDIEDKIGMGKEEK